MRLSPGKMRNRLASKIVQKDWNYVIERTVKCPGEASEWVEVNFRGSIEKLLPLHVACCLDPPVDAVQALLKADSEAILLQDANGRLPLHLACDVNRASPEVIEVLLEAHPEGSEVKENQFGFLPLHAACCKSDNAKTCIDTQQKVIEKLLSAFPSAITETDGRGWLPLALACRTGAHPNVIEILLKEKPSAAKVIDRDLRMPIHLALCSRPGGNEATEIARMLIDAYPSSLMRQEKKFGFLPLHVACSFCGLSSSNILVRTLLAAYPEASQVPDRRGSLPLHLACRAGAPFSVIQQLVSVYPRGAFHKDDESRLPLHWACHLNLPAESIHIILDTYPMAARIAETKYKFLPLHVACLRGASKEIIDILLQAYPDGSSCRDKKGCLPLHVACMANCDVSTEAIESIIKAFPQALAEKDSTDATPLDIAKEGDKHDKKEIIQVLLEYLSTESESDVPDISLVNQENEIIKPTTKRPILRHMSW